MKKIAVVLAACAALFACSSPKEVSEADFNATVDGKQVSLYTLEAGNLKMQVTNYGARVVTLWAPDKDGAREDIVLGYNNLEMYLNNPGERFLGAVVGPYANRIAKGTYTLNGETYNFPQNNNGQTLHGGDFGLDRVVWDVDTVTANSLVLSYLHKDFQEGMP